MVNKGFVFVKPHKKESQNVMSGDLGGHFNNVYHYDQFVVGDVHSDTFSRYYENEEAPNQKAQNVLCGFVGSMLTILSIQERRIFQNLEYLVAFTTLYTLGTKKMKKKGTFFFRHGGTKSLFHHYLKIWWSCEGGSEINFLPLQESCWCEYGRKWNIA
ncbi:hypothetical protein TNIN_259771 [Trichonephila inaurata madagascariensis]|uniref:Uncharacterized protein n=1 Tax=Trichonephila inaurata madagascariensis TaxID=2747483 RepID=A0A8X6K006_9ARAC|nr:hypothetical protein TNIN_259771 [Trichonephila inaurata madagascariensis]